MLSLKIYLHQKRKQSINFQCRKNRLGQIFFSFQQFEISKCTINYRKNIHSIVKFITNKFFVITYKCLGMNYNNYVRTSYGFVKYLNFF